MGLEWASSYNGIIIRGKDGRIIDLGQGGGLGCCKKSAVYMVYKSGEASLRDSCKLGKYRRKESALDNKEIAISKI